MTAQTKDELLEIYRKMYLIRRFEEVAIKMYRQGFIPGYFHPYIGEEAIAVGAISALTPEDYIVSTHRGHGHCLAKGAEPRRMMAELFGRATGYCRGWGGSMHIADVDGGNLGANGIVGAGIPIAVGAALGARLLGKNLVAMSFFSDGAFANGIFPESLNLAAIYKLPVVFILENNRYAVSMPVSNSTCAVDLARIADTYCVPGIVVEGNDVLSVRRETAKAVDRARSGEGPTLIECKTMRMGGHHINDPGDYMDKEELERWKSRDPIELFRKTLLKGNNITEEELINISRGVKSVLEEAVAYASESPEPDVGDFLKEASMY